MNAQPQLRSNSAEAPQRWLPNQENDDQVQIGEQEKQGKENREHCKMCLEDKLDLLLLDCGHRYCNACLDHHIQLLLNLQDFPPRCCGQAISVYKYSDVLSHGVLSRYLRARTRKACQGDTRCAGSECTDKRSIISRYLIEDEWGLCEKCHQVTCARCQCLRVYHKGDGKARVCPTTIRLTGTNPTTIDLTTTQSTTVDLTTEDPPSKEDRAQECSKCDELISHTGGRSTMPCPCGAIICLKCAGTHRKTQSLIPFGCWCRLMAQSQPQPRSAICEKVSGVFHPPTSASNTSAAPGNIHTGVDSDRENKLPPIMAPPQEQLMRPQLIQQQQPMQRQQGVHQGQVQELVNPHFWSQQINPGQCNRCNRPEQAIAQCSKCGEKSCRMCSRSSCDGRPTISTLQMPQNDNRGLITSASFPTPDRVRHALDGKENGLTRNQISQALSCPVEFLNKILGQMLNTNLIWVLNTDHETRYGLRRTPQPCADDASASASDVVYYGMLHQNSHPQPDAQWQLSDQTSAGSHRPNSEPQASTALDILAKACHGHLEEGGLPEAWIRRSSDPST